FPPPSKATTSIKLAEPPHDLKRTMTSTVEGPLAPHSCASASERRQTPLSLRSPLASPHARACRTTLPRAVLPDAAPAVGSLRPRPTRTRIAPGAFQGGTVPWAEC